MNRKMAWKLLGVAGFLLGAWQIGWSLWHFHEPPMGSSGGWLYNASYEGALQWRMLFTGIATMMLSYIAYRKGTQ
jgi:hypothetical protein